MPMRFRAGGEFTLNQSLRLTGSRSPHPAWENNMTTALAQLEVPTVVFWEVIASLSGYRATYLNGLRISSDDNQCVPWAQFEPRGWGAVQRQVAPYLSRDVSTPYQMHLALAKRAFPGVVQSSAEFYLNNRHIVEPALRAIAKSNYAGHFSKVLRSDGSIVSSTNAYVDHVRYDAAGQVVLKTDLAQRYLGLLETVRASELNPGFNPLSIGEWGVLPDARIMSVLDSAIFALGARTDTVYAWSGTAMFQYILKEGDSQRWRELVSHMYDIVRREALPGLPETLNFILLPTHGLDKLVIVDRQEAHHINESIQAMRTPRQYTKTVITEEFNEATMGMSMDALEQFLLSKSPQASHAKIRKVCQQGNIQAAIGVAAHAIHLDWQQRSTSQVAEARDQLRARLVKGGKLILHNQPFVGPLQVLQGQSLHLVEGVLDTPMGKLDAVRAYYENLAQPDVKTRREPSADSYESFRFSHGGWDW